MFSNTNEAYIDAFSVLNFVMSNDGEGASTLSTVAVIDHVTWLVTWWDRQPEVFLPLNMRKCPLY